ncbi:hypothetical protein ACVWZR_003057 [Bradyrhizobium sp. i1.3.1]
MDADEFALVLEALGQRGDRQRRGVRREDHVRLHMLLRLREGISLDLAILEHGLDDEVDVLECSIIGSRRNAREQRVGVTGLGAALLDLLLDHLLSMRLALVGTLLVAVDQDDVETGAGRDVADARTHEAGADHRDLLHLGRGYVLRAARALVQLLHRQEQAADHRGCFLRTQHRGEVARLDAQRGVDRQLQAFIDAAHDRARGRIIVVGLPAIDRVASREHHHAGLGEHRTARQLEALLVPGRDRLAATLDPVLRRLDEVACGNDGVNQIKRLGLLDRDRIALEQDRHRVLRRHQARHALRAAGAGEQADLDLGQAEARLGIFRRDAVVGSTA